MLLCAHSVDEHTVTPAKVHSIDSSRLDCHECVEESKWIVPLELDADGLRCSSVVRVRVLDALTNEEEVEWHIEVDNTVILARCVD